MFQLSFLNQPFSWKNLSILFIVTFLIRASVFQFYIQHEQRYQQPDSYDYHICAFALAHNLGMTRVISREPIFWRTPGYPVYLMPFYSHYNTHNTVFDQQTSAQKTALWIQIVLCSCIPILILFLAFFLTQVSSIAWITAWIFAFHPGFVLSSSYLLTDGLAAIFFFSFLLFFFKFFYIIGEQAKEKSNILNSFYYIVCAALSLAGYTWMRPNGKFVAIFSTIILLLCNTPWKKTVQKAGLFFLIFFTAISPWYIRNHNLTGRWFFCPMSGPYVQAFIAPKIMRTITGKPLDTCSKTLMRNMTIQYRQEKAKQKKINPAKFFPREFAAESFAWPIAYQHPFIFAWEWTKEVIKTTFDLYSSQFTAFANNSFKYDPPEEFLLEKIAFCLYKQSMPLSMRLVCWIEFLFSILTWIGLLGGLWLFLIKPLCISLWSPPYDKISFLWLKAGLFIGSTLIMTGGFGYARLRMPAEPLMIILSLTFWYWLFSKKKAFK